MEIFRAIDAYLLHCDYKISQKFRQYICFTERELAKLYNHNLTYTNQFLSFLTNSFVQSGTLCTFPLHIEHTTFDPLWKTVLRWSLSFIAKPLSRGCFSQGIFSCVSLGTTLKSSRWMSFLPAI